MTEPPIRVGTASWTDPTLTKESDWYPSRSMSAEDRLRFYASRFSMVEVDATYYFPPTTGLVEKWVARAPDAFRFDVKAYSLLTGHPTTTKSLWKDVAEELPADQREKRRIYLKDLPDDLVDAAWEHFREALMPLHSAGKLGAVFFQFPPWFHPGRAARGHLTEVAERLPDYDVAVEFRNAMWFGDGDTARTLDLLESLGLAYVCVDGPQGFDNSIPPVLATTTPDLAVVRFHGHNRENWNKKGISAAERFRYRYTDEELADWAPKIRDLAESARETHVVMNNCYRDYGVRNAATFASLLSVDWHPPED